MRTFQQVCGFGRRGRFASAALALFLSACAGTSGSVPATSPRAATGPLGDTWTWKGSGWTQIRTNGGPSARFTTAMAYDADRHRLILFGGSGLLDQFGDTWSWDGQVWTQSHPVHHPGTLSDHLMAYDEARRQVVLYGGLHGLYEKGSPITETWTWDGQDWSLRATTGPPSLKGMAMAFDPLSRRLILFGGSRYLNHFYSNATWSWDGKGWTILPQSASPAPRNGVALGYDRASQALVLFGGAVENTEAGGGGAGITVGDTWSFGGGSWKLLSPRSSPTARSHAVIAYDTPGRRLILFSGTACPFRSETWAWDGADWKLLGPSTSPQPRTQASISADPDEGSLVLFGGLADSPCL